MWTNVVHIFEKIYKCVQNFLIGDTNARISPFGFRRYSHPSSECVSLHLYRLQFRRFQLSQQVFEQRYGG
jgi:hypothetical protein